MHPQTVTLTGANTTAAFRIPVEAEGRHHGMTLSPMRYLTVDGIRLDWFKLDNTMLTLNLNASGAAALHVPFQSGVQRAGPQDGKRPAQPAKALNGGTHDALEAIFRLADYLGLQHRQDRAGGPAITNSAMTSPSPPPPSPASARAVHRSAAILMVRGHTVSARALTMDATLHQSRLRPVRLCAHRHRAVRPRFTT